MTRFARQTAGAFLMLLVCGCAGQQQEATKERNWSDKTGKQTVVATFVKQTATHVTLRKRDETTKTVPIAALSEADQQFLNALHVAEDIPGEGDAIKLVANRWTYKPSGAKVVVPEIAKVNVPHGAESRVRIVVSANGRWVAVTVQGNDGVRNVSVVDLQNGSARIASDLPGSVVGVHNDGDHLASSLTYMDDNKYWNDYWITKLDGRVLFSAKRVNQLGYPSSPFIGDRFIRIGRRRADRQCSLNIVDWRTRKTAYEFNVVSRTFDAGISVPDVIAVTPDGGTLAVIKLGKIFLVDAETGKIRGSLAIPSGLQPDFFQFSPDGTRFAGASSAAAYVWDLEREGERTTVALPHYRRGRSLFRRTQGRTPSREFLHTFVDWADDRFLLADGVLVDTRISYPVWHYHSDMNRTLAGRRIKHVAGRQFVSIQPTDDGTRLVPFLLPHDKAMEHGIQPEDIVRFGRGDKIRLEADFSLLSDFDEMSLIASMKKRLTSSGFVVSEDAKVQLIATITKGDPKEFVIREYYRGRQKVTPEGSDEENTHTMTPYTASMELRTGEHTLYSVNRNGEPSSERRLVIKQNETVEQALERFSVPDLRFFQTVALPEQTSALRNGKRIGVSTYDSGSIRDEQ